MTVTYGFYNSSNNDRKYSALQMSSLFDGIITNGVFAAVGSGLVVGEGTGNFIIYVGTGRAWFNNTWTNNDAILPLTVTSPNVSHPRIDLVVLEVDSTSTVRVNSIKIVDGEAATPAVAPIPIHTDTVHQYVLAEIAVAVGTTGITNANITNKIGVGDTPFITGPLVTVDAEDLYAQWQSTFTNWYNATVAQYNLWYAAMTAEQLLNMDDWEDQFNIWFSGIQAAQLISLAAYQNDFDALFNQLTVLLETDLLGPWETTWLAWFNAMQGQLTTDAAGNLQTQINTLRIPLTTNRTYYVRTDGNDGNNGLSNDYSGAFATIQKAVDVACNLDLRDYDVTISVNTGTYNGAILKPYIGNGRIVLSGNIGDPGSVEIMATGTTPDSTYGFYLSSDVRYKIRGFTISSNDGAGCVGIYVSKGDILIENVIFGSFANGTHMKILDKASLEVQGEYTLDGPALTHCMIYDYGIFRSNDIFVIFSTSLSMVNWILTFSGGIANVSGITFTNKNYLSGKRYDASLNAIINTQGQASNYLPGNVAGTVETGGQYV